MSVKKRDGGWQRFMWRVAAAAAVSVSIGACLLLSRRRIVDRFAQYSQRVMRQMLAGVQLQDHFDRTRRTCADGQRRLAKRLLDTIDSRMSTDLLLGELSHSSGARKLQVWRQLKRLAVQRVFAAVYGCVYLVVTLQVYTHALAGYLGCERRQSSSSADPSLSDGDQQTYFSHVERFMEIGVPQLLDALSQLLAPLADQLSLKQLLSLQQLELQLKQAQLRLESAADVRLSRFVLTDGGSAVDDQRVRRMQAETGDILGGAEIDRLVNECASAALNRVLDMLAASFHTVANGGCSLPVAKLVPLLCRLPADLLGERCDSLHWQIANHSRVQALAANVYECFGQ